jgi:CheY-like chemotaxis protein
VLVVDDNPDQVMMLTGSLRLNGFTVRSAGTGTEGLAIALEWRPDIVLLDIGMPGLDGYEVARRLRAAEKGGSGGWTGVGGPFPRRVRLIALSGHGRPADKTRAREAGFDAHLTKPCDLDYLAMMMASLMPAK